MATESRQRNCSKCKIELVNPTGIHMGIPFGLWYTQTNAPRVRDQMIVCTKCYDEVSIQRTGEETI